MILKQWKLQPRQETAVTLRSDLDLQRHSAFKICPRTKVNVLPLFHKYYYQLPPNMAFQLANEICCIKHCWDLNKQNTFLVDDWTAKLVTICFILPGTHSISQVGVGREDTSRWTRFDQYRRARRYKDGTSIVSESMCWTGPDVCIDLETNDGVCSHGANLHRIKGKKQKKHDKLQTKLSMSPREDMVFKYIIMAFASI